MNSVYPSCGSKSRISILPSQPPPMANDAMLVLNRAKKMKEELKALRSKIAE
jgi:hypothetical protein